MSSAMTSPTWYDLLDVEPDATTDEIRAAWKAAIADLDPTDRRFRTRNEAAAVLLDEQKRAAYDAELATQQAESDEAESEDEAGDAAAEATPAVEDEEPGDEPVGDTDEADEADEAAVEEVGGRTLPLLPTWSLVAAGVLALAAVVGAGVVFFGQEKVTTVANNNVTTSVVEGAVGKEISRNHKLLVEEHGAAALEAAKKAAVPLLSYDYSKMDESQAAAHEVMTSSEKKDYDRIFAVLVDNVPETKTVVKTLKPVDAGVIRVSEDAVQVLVLVDRQVTNAQQTTPIGYQEYAMLTMAKVGDEWLVDKLETQPSKD
ncbi:J domain-containing protein [Nocardioides sp. NPDC059952]|uniref:J domain-containing protein n=1 Tax=Nocardioides sp. NPDC059952 TaxID=3347014 RepID=UPI003658FA92